MKAICLKLWSALGDCNGKGAFTHTAYNDYEIVAENLFDGKQRKVSDRITTYNLFVDPPMGRVGLTKKEAIAKGYKVAASKLLGVDSNHVRILGQSFLISRNSTGSAVWILSLSAKILLSFSFDREGYNKKRITS